MQPVELTWLGQAGFVIDVTDGVRLLIDPFMSGHEARLYPPPALDALGAPLDWLLVTHEHLDHLDTAFLPRLLERSPDLRLVLPEPIAEQVEGLIPRQQVTTVQPGDIVELARGTTVEVVPAYHARAVGDGYGDGSVADGLVRFVGYILRTASLALYHSGDSIVTPGLLEALSGKRIDVALLPINGRDFFREEAGLVGNMNAREAVELARRLEARLLVPMHWDLFAGNTVPPGSALDEIDGIDAQFHILILARCQPFRLC